MHSEDEGSDVDNLGASYMTRDSIDSIEDNDDMEASILESIEGDPEEYEYEEGEEGEDDLSDDGEGEDGDDAYEEDGANQLLQDPPQNITPPRQIDLTDAASRLNLDDPTPTPTPLASPRRS